MQASFFYMRLSRVETIAPGVKEFVLLPEENVPPLSFVPGQFITLQFEHGQQSYKRSYSLANPPAENGRLVFTASYVENGIASEYLFQLKPGALLQVMGPYGRLILKEPFASRYILVGTGTGITPYRSMWPQIQSLLSTQQIKEIVLVHGARTQKDLLYAAEFRQWAQTHPQVRCLFYLSRESGVLQKTDERAGYVQGCFNELSLRPTEDKVYLCGNPNMIDDAFRLLTEQGLSVTQIMREKYLSKGK